MIVKVLTLTISLIYSGYVISMSQDLPILIGDDSPSYCYVQEALDTIRPVIGQFTLYWKKRRLKISSIIFPQYIFEACWIMKKIVKLIRCFECVWYIVWWFISDWNWMSISTCSSDEGSSILLLSRVSCRSLINFRNFLLHGSIPTDWFEFVLWFL